MVVGALFNLRFDFSDFLGRDDRGGRVVRDHADLIGASLTRYQADVDTRCMNIAQRVPSRSHRWWWRRS
jgi:hypothetical protein